MNFTFLGYISQFGMNLAVLLLGSITFFIFHTKNTMFVHYSVSTKKISIIKVKKKCQNFHVGIFFEVKIWYKAALFNDGCLSINLISVYITWNTYISLNKCSIVIRGQSCKEVILESNTVHCSVVLKIDNFFML